MSVERVIGDPGNDVWQHSIQDALLKKVGQLVEQDRDDVCRSVRLAVTLRRAVEQVAEDGVLR